jgi:hypothetical protein
MLILHWEDLPEDAIGSVEGVPVTKAARSLRDCAEAHLGPALLRQAIDDGQREGWLAARESEALRNELFGGRRWWWAPCTSLPESLGSPEAFENR